MKKILILHTGGTMGMTASATPTLIGNDFKHSLFQYIPDIKAVAEIEFVALLSIDSSNISVNHWIQIANVIEANMDKYDGFVIIHGTDTMSYTASALSYMLGNLPKPVVLTGSQRPLSEIRTDAKNNLINAIELATLDIPEVSVFFDNKLFRGNRSKKISIDDFDAFTSPNYPTLAEVGLHIEIKNNHRQPRGLFRVDSKLQNEVFCMRLFPGLLSDQLDALAGTSFKIFILEAFGAGNVPILDHSLIPWIEKVNKIGKMVALASQCLSGSVDLTLYECGQVASKAGAISCGDMTTESAIIKAMFLLGQFDGQVAKVKSNFGISIAGEVSE